MKQTNKILLLGGGGFIGKNIQNIWQQDISTYWGKVSDPYLLTHIRDEKFNTVVHLASSLVPSSGAKDFYHEMQSLILPTFKLIDYLGDKKIKLVYFSSGGCIYTPSVDPIKETHPLEARNLYGHSKILIEDYIRYVSRTKGLEYIIVRPTATYGVHQRISDQSGFITNVIYKILRGEEVTIYGDGSIMRDFVEVTYLVRTVEKLLKPFRKNLTVNIGGGSCYSLSHVVSIVEEELLCTAKIKYIPARPVDAKIIQLDVTTLLQQIPYHPLPNLEHCIKTYIQHLKFKPNENN